MTSVNSIAGNNGFSKVGNTVLSSSVLNSAFSDAGLLSLKSVKGRVTPTAPGNYAVVDEKGAYVTLPLNSIITRVLLSATSNLTEGGLPGATTALVSLGPTAGSASSSQTQTATAANMILRVSPSLTSAASIGDAANRFVTVTTVGTFTAGSIDVTVLYL